MADRMAKVNALLKCLSKAEWQVEGLFASLLSESFGG